MVLKEVEEFGSQNSTPVSDSSEITIFHEQMFAKMQDKESEDLDSPNSTTLPEISIMHEHFMTKIHNRHQLNNLVSQISTPSVSESSEITLVEVKEPNGEVLQNGTVVTHDVRVSISNFDSSRSYTHLNWIYEAIDHPSIVWCICSQIVIFVVGFFTKLVMAFFNKTKVHNQQRLLDAVVKRDLDVPLITISNHRSGFDDPGLWGAILPLRYVCNTYSMRWSMAASEVCFSNKIHSLGFMYAKCIPIIRGIGVYQEAVDICIRKCKLGHWIHMFPEGQVFKDKPMLPLKTGVGRIIYESPRVPIILPIWHEGIHEIMPVDEPGSFKIFKNITVNVGEPLDLNGFIQNLRNEHVPEPIARQIITDKIQEVLQKLRVETQALHALNW